MQQIRSIVLIDDDHDDAELFRDAVAEVNPVVSVRHFSNGKDALRVLSSEPSLPDVLFLDINLPSSSGWQCLTEIRRHDYLKQLPVIMFSTSSQQREKDIAKDLGAVGFVTKPNGFNRLKTVLADILRLPVERLAEAFRPAT